jgi:hypothetical protein
MDANIFFKNGDVTEPTLNATGEGAFKIGFNGAFADEKAKTDCGCEPQQQEEENLGFTRNEILDSIRTNPKTTIPKDENADILRALQNQDTKISKGTWIAIGVVGLVIFGGLGYILYKKYK